MEVSKVFRQNWNLPCTRLASYPKPTLDFLTSTVWLVHFCMNGQGCSCMCTGDFDEACLWRYHHGCTTGKVNWYLPPDICILVIVKMSWAFCAKTQHDQACYTYMLPSFFLYDHGELQDVFETVHGSSPNQGHSAQDLLTGDEKDGLHVVIAKFHVTT